MPPAEPAGTGRVQFCGCELDLDSGELLRAGTRVYLPEQPLQVLKALLERPGEVVSREELRRRLWSENTFVDFEQGLNKAVARLRESLGDSAEHPAIVERVPRRGYRLISAIEHAAVEDPGLSVDTPPTVTPPSLVEPPRAAARRATRIALVALGLTLVAGTSLLVRSVWPRPPIRAIAVLRLEEPSGDPAQDHFAEGLSDELIAALGRASQVRVTSRATAMRYRSTQRPVREITGELGVDVVLTGSLSRSRTRVQVTVELTQAGTEAPRWRASFERELADVPTLPADIARKVVDWLDLPPPASSDALRPARKVKPEAYDAYLRGRHHWFRGGRNELARARAFFQAAIDEDPTYAAAHAGLADYFLAGGVSGYWPASEAVPWGRVAAQKACALDDSLPEAHLSLAAVHLFYDWDWLRAEQEANRALELNPSSAEALHVQAMILGVLGRAGQALELERAALQLDPFARPWSYGRALLWAGQTDAAIEELERGARTNPEAYALSDTLGLAYQVAGRLDEALTRRRRGMELSGDRESAASLGRAHASGGHAAVHRLELERLRETAKREYVSPLEFARWTLAAGDRDASVEWLRRAYVERTPRLVRLRQDPAFAALRDDPRFRELAAKIGLP